jgi:hypothetical protein
MMVLADSMLDNYEASRAMANVPFLAWGKSLLKEFEHPPNLAVLPTLPVLRN